MSPSAGDCSCRPRHCATCKKLPIYIRDHADIDRTNTWANALLDSLESLAHMLARYALAPESRDAVLKVRHQPYYSHRIIFRIHEEMRMVQVLRVYHDARTPLRLDDLS